MTAAFVTYAIWGALALLFIANLWGWWVKRRGLSPRAKAHVEKMDRWFDRLKDDQR